MLEIGNYNTLEIAREVDFGFYLKSSKGDILLPRKYIPDGAKIGDELEVFIYKDSEDRLIATTLKPKAIVGQFACLQVKQVSKIGAFLEWGLEKDLFVPHAEQHKPMEEGKSYVVRIALDPKTERIIGISKIGAFISREVDELTPGDQVELMVYEITDLGYMALIDEKFRGIIYKNEVFAPLNVGDKLIGYVKKVREDQKIDLTLQKFGYREVVDAKDIVYDILVQNQGLMQFSDHSSPEDIKQTFKMSKKTFKKALGALFKEGKILLEEKSIRLNSH